MSNLSRTSLSIQLKKINTVRLRSEQDIFSWDSLITRATRVHWLWCIIGGEVKWRKTKKANELTKQRKYHSLFHLGKSKVWCALLILPLSEWDEWQWYESMGFCLLFRNWKQSYRQLKIGTAKNNWNRCLTGWCVLFIERYLEPLRWLHHLAFYESFHTFSTISSLSSRASDLVSERTSNGIVVDNTRVFLAEFLRAAVEENASLSSNFCLETVLIIIFFSNRKNKRQLRNLPTPEGRQRKSGRKPKWNWWSKEKGHFTWKNVSKNIISEFSLACFFETYVFFRFL